VFFNDFDMLVSKIKKNHFDTFSNKNIFKKYLAPQYQTHTNKEEKTKFVRFNCSFWYHKVMFVHNQQHYLFRNQIICPTCTLGQMIFFSIKGA
jgi:hypothetical protein